MLKTTYKDAFRSIQLNSGVLLSGADIGHIDGAEAMKALIDAASGNGEGFIGACAGGCRFSAVPRITRFSRDGEVFDRPVGVVVIKWDVRLEVSLLDFKADNLLRILNDSSILHINDTADMLNMNTSALNQAGSNLIWCGDLSGGGLLVVELKNALCVGGLAFDTASDGEGLIHAVFAPQVGSFFNPDDPPFNILYLH
ncbi:MAG: hypothetical protein LBS19_11975 [Clostridiales bacterium]|jgi:hypothetical protein|nr:hypothetical protein [Clostridiales bacterium]